MRTRSEPIVVAAFALVAPVLLVLAASSAPQRLWTIDLPDPGPAAPATVAPATTLVQPPPAEGDLSDPQPRSMPWLWVLAVPLVAIAGAAALDVRLGRGWLPGSRARSRRRHALPVAPLPEVGEDQPIVSLDVVAARAALAVGTPRNAIVACWMQLERDAEAAGLPRLDAETAGEYVERLIASSSVDPAPVGRLAALYREARFSRHALTDEHRARAIDALDRVADALRSEPVPA